MLKKNLNSLCVSSLIFLSGCSTIGSLAGAAIATKAGENALVGSVIGGVAGQAIGNATGQVATGALGQVI
ncbi:MAG TPA: hypothetical protein ENJ51_09480 [Leucothrix mucor]|uniref:Glycine zipper 2TM domain-containing protein n=1 Tax=Leucothrix mucor TaxID=45248 RepID=A0A7V2T0R6_LEUMU|nr:hypothetical protein [Leucothrix mucor]